MIGNKNGFEGIEHTAFLNKGLMVIQNSRWGEITRRIFEGMACGKLVITDKLVESKKLHKLFIDNLDIVYYDDMTDCINKINYYAEHTEERERIAKSGMNKVLENHTQIQIVNKLLEQWKSYRYQ
jgi:spore maturation protein CgeB